MQIIYLYRSVVPGHKSSKSLVKVIKAKMERSGKKVTFHNGEVGYVEVTEHTANVDYINREIKSLWGNGYRIMTADGTEVKDCSGTRGTCNVYALGDILIN